MKGWEALATIAFFASGCRAHQSAQAPPDVVEAVTPDTTDKVAVGGYCLPLPLRQHRLDLAWGVGTRTFICLQPAFDPPTQASRVCLSVDRSNGSYRGEPPTMTGERLRPKPAVLPVTSASGKIAYSLRGGLRTPHGATQTLTDLTTGKAKTATLDYDEHIAFAGFVGDGVVLRTWLDEGPGCVQWLVDPTAAWPAVLSAGIGLNACQGHPTLLLAATRGRYAFVSGNGYGITFVDPSLSVTEVTTGQLVPPAEGNLEILVADGGRWLLAFGGGQAADVVEIDVDGMKLVRAFSPPICPP